MRLTLTSGRLVAAISFAITGYLTALAYIPTLPDSYIVTWFPEASALLGAQVGWIVMGRHVGGGLREAMGRGVSTAVWLLFWALVSFSIHEMLSRALDKRYRQPMEAVGAFLEIGIYFFKLALSVEVLGTLVIGGLISAVLAELANRIWR
ncbi:MAG: TrgA family protein [Alphaproteobacteria bacterium]|nr:TrgA family protein [Alphaproteobacteria bacterium]